jgi:alpha-ketoglutarate-dependent taurine dioxygenase
MHKIMSLDVQPITPTVGAFVRIAAGDVVQGGVPEQILAALERFGVLVFPQIGMSDETFLKLTAALGDKHENDVTADGTEASDKGIFRIALDKSDKTQLDFIKGNDYWHMDGMSYSVPCKATLLKCESAPREGGDTGFANLYAAYDALPDETKARLEGVRVGHCLSAVGRKMYASPAQEDFDRWDAVFPRLEHPLVWKQANGRSALLIGSTANDVVGMDVAEGQALLEGLLEWCTQDRFTYRHRWQQGDLVIFHYPGLLHRSYPYSDAAHRVMHRTTLKGSEEIAARSLHEAGAS